MLDKTLRHFLTGLLVAAIDLLSKHLARISGLPITENHGLAFSLPTESPVSILASGIIITLLLLFFIRLQPYLTELENLAFGLIIGGAIGNFIDRLINGYVTDFMRIGNAVYNIADFAVFAGIGLVIISSFFLNKASPKA